jgi:HEAT repeat protein
MSDNTAESVPNGNAIRLATKVYEALIVQRLTDKYKAIEMLNDTTLRIDRAMLRTLVLKAIRDDYYVGREIELDNADVAFTRSWLLNVLGHVADDDPDAMQVIHKHLKSNEEPNRWGRFWALEGLIASRNKRVREIAEQVAESRSEDLLAPTLAVAYLAADKDIPALKRIRDYLSQVEKQWFALRALRVVPLPSTVPDLCRIVDEAAYSDGTYDAIMALGNVPTDWPQSKQAAQSLSGCIEKLRRSPWQDGMRTGAIAALGNLKVETAAGVLLDELVDDNPAIVREAARSMKKILGLNLTVARIAEAAVKGGSGVIEAYGRALRWLDREQTAEQLGNLMASGTVAQQDLARLLLSELGGTVAFEKLRARTDAMKQYNDLLEKTEQSVRALFDRSVREAQNGFQLAVLMDVVIFALGVLLVVGSAGYALYLEGDLSSWAGVGVAGGVGVLGIIYGTLIANPRRQVRESVDHLMRLKITFLAYLRRLHQADQAYTRRLLDDKQLNLDEIRSFSNIVGDIMDTTLERHGPEAAKHAIDVPAAK